MNKIFILLLLQTFILATLSAQKVSNAAIKNRLAEYRKDARGPYKDIRWFCEDGSTVAPKDTCPNRKGVQRARYKDEIVALGRSNHIFLGQILSTSPKAEFWDAEHYHSRLKQFQLEKYLRSVDDGWVLEKAQFYRGAFQIEDEEEWGVEFFNWLFDQQGLLDRHFFLIRQAAKDIPHKGDSNKAFEIRALSKTISDEYPAFMNLRVKIHGQPEQSDIASVKSFKAKHEEKLSSTMKEKMDKLVLEMEEEYRPVNLAELKTFLVHLPAGSKMRQSLETFKDNFNAGDFSPARLKATAEQAALIRNEINQLGSRKAKLAALDISNALGDNYFKEAIQWEPATIGELMEKIYYSSMMAYATGFIESWEWEQLQPDLMPSTSRNMELAELTAYLDRARSVVEWGTGMVRAVYKDVVNLYGGFEPLAFGFYDDRIRSSVLLGLGASVGDLGDRIAAEANLSNQVLNLRNQSQIRGLNPGYAKGKLVVVTGNEEEVAIEKDKIYIFQHPPSDLKPVAGILTVSEGNMVSHVQLLARNLGIPNAVISAQNFEDFKIFDNQDVFFAVSNRSTVLMKPVGLMNGEEQKLFEQKKRKEEKISVPANKIILSVQDVVNMRKVNATHSGKLCGPKAANLGQLKQLFPDKVVEGLVLPFGVFRKHMDQLMPGQDISYWQFLNGIFYNAIAMLRQGHPPEEVDEYVLSELSCLRTYIKDICLYSDFMEDLENSFRQVFGKEMGSVPVFLRSDTNMEDLKDFTGAGLNLTLFNVVSADAIWEGIREVWASPYTERSFQWRQRYLLNPEQVYPSILIIPSVDVEYSGVLITKGITSGDEDDLTIAFSRGAGGAVDGQAAESWLLEKNGDNQLLSPAREPTYRRLPERGGTATYYATFERPILKQQNLDVLRAFTNEVYDKLPKAEGIETEGPFDIELGFKDDKLWLFQVRPFVENKNALSSEYLMSISPEVPGSKKISLR